MKISVAIPTYNRANIISETLNSVLAQSYTVDEIVVVDDGSEDNTETIVNSISDKILYKKIDNSGPAIARKHAIGLCKNEWIALCDSDDLWEVDHIRNFVSCMKIHPEVNIYFSNFSTTDNPDRDKFSTAPGDWWSRAIQLQSPKSDFCLMNKSFYINILEFQPIFQSALVFSKELYESIGGISASLGRINSEDAHLTRRLVSRGTTACSFENSVAIRRHAENYSSDDLANLQGRLVILERLCSHGEIPEEYLNITQNEIASSRGMLFDHLYWGKQYRGAVQLAKKVGLRNLTRRQQVKFCVCLALSFVSINKD